MDDEQLGLFDPEEMEVKLTREQQAAKDASELYRRWHAQWYEGRYTQAPGHIIKVFKTALLHGISVYHLEWAANMLGKERAPITEPSVQFKLREIDKINQIQGHGARSTAVEEIRYE